MEGLCRGTDFTSRLRNIIGNVGVSVDHNRVDAALLAQRTVEKKHVSILARQPWCQSLPG